MRCYVITFPDAQALLVPPSSGFFSSNMTCDDCEVLNKFAPIRGYQSLLVSVCDYVTARVLRLLR